MKTPAFPHLQLGAVFPQYEIPPDRQSIVAFGAAVESCGYDHVLAYDHILGVDQDAASEWDGLYDVDTSFHEPLTLFAFLAGFTSLGVCSNILVLPQRDTALVAKQAAFLDAVTNSGFRLGVGVGWNRAEYAGLGKEFNTRGRRLDQQIDYLRSLWSMRSTDHHTKEGALRLGISPRPGAGAIPIWVGGESDAAYRRAGRLGDGWIPRVKPGPELDHAFRVMRDEARKHERDPDALGLQARVSWTGSAAALRDEAVAWVEAGATHLAISTLGAGLRTVDEHIDVLATAMDVLTD